MVTSQGAWRERRGWLLRLESSEGGVGWGEAADLEQASRRPGDPTPRPLEAALQALPQAIGREALEQRLPQLPRALACAVGMALAELDGVGAAERGGWRPSPPSAWLLPAGEAAIPALEALLSRPDLPTPKALPQEIARRTLTLTLKWKVAAADDDLERRLLEALLARLPAGGHLRLDANGGWDRHTAAAWAEQLAQDPRLEWFEQPLPPEDQQGLMRLASRVPVALDESLRCSPALIEAGWPGWQVRRPLAEGDPRPLLRELERGRPRLMLSTAFETGIGRRWLEHLAALQALGPTPTAPGLAPGWRPQGALFAADPTRVWQAAAPP